MGNIEIVHSQSHLIFPKIILIVFGLLGIGLIIQRIISTKRLKLEFVDSEKFSFFEKNMDKTKFIGTFVALILFVVAMKYLSFIVGGIIGMSILNLLYNDSHTNKNVLISIIISVVETLVVWFLFSNVFGVTLP